MTVYWTVSLTVSVQLSQTSCGEPVNIWNLSPPLACGVESPHLGAFLIQSRAVTLFLLGGWWLGWGVGGGGVRGRVEGGVGPVPRP